MKISILSLSMLLCTAIAQSPFNQWDKNKDGKLVIEELPKPLQKNFNRVDSNKDGVISRAEDAAFRNRAPGLPQGVSATKNIDYSGTNNSRQMLDLYLPVNAAAADKPLPVVCWIHGGGWRAGNKNAMKKLLPLLKSGKYIGVSIGYRLSDEAQWPAQIHDCKAAIRWIRANAASHNMDPNRIAVWGSSAGGHLVAMLGVSQQVPGLEGEIGPHTNESSAVTCVVNYYGPAEMLTMNDNPVGTMDHNAADSPESKLLGGTLPEVPEIAKNASPLTHVSKDDTPMLLIHGTKDLLVAYQQSVKLDQALDAVGVPSSLITVNDAGHGGGFGPTTGRLVAEFLGQHLLGEGAAVIDQTIQRDE